MTTTVHSDNAQALAAICSATACTHCGEEVDCDAALVGGYVLCVDCGGDLDEWAEAREIAFDLVEIGPDGLWRKEGS